VSNINPDRLLSDLKHLRTFGATGPGVVRLSLSPVDMAARRWLAGRMNDAGLSASIDGVGTVFGRSRNAGPALLIGSHTDSGVIEQAAVRAGMTTMIEDAVAKCRSGVTSAAEVLRVTTVR